MKPSKLLQSFLLAAGSSLLAVSSASAQNVNGTWLGNGNAWNDPTAWTGGAGGIANGTGAANFTGVNLTSDVTMALGANRTIGNITFTDATTSSHNLTLTGNTLTLGTSTINVTQSDRNLTISSILAGTAGFTKSGQGTLILGGINTITGATVISGGGTLVLDYTTNDNRKLSNNSTLSLAAGTIVLKGGTATENMTGGTTFNTGTNGTFFVRDGGTSKINLNGFTIGTGSTVSFSHNSMATTDRLNTIGILGSWFTVGNRWATNAGVNGAGGSAGAGAAVDGDIVGYTGGATFTNALVTDNNTNADLSGALTLSGAKTVNTLRIESTADNQVLNIGTHILSTSNLTGANTATGGGILYAGGANGNYTIQGTTGGLRITNQNGQGQLINVFSGTLTVDAIIGSGTSPLVKTGEGTLDMKKDNAYGSLRVYQGVARLSHNNALDTTSTVQNGAAIELSNGISVGAFASTITGTGIANGGALRSLATTASSFAGAITIGTGGARINSDSTGTLTLSGGVVTASGNDVTFGGAGNTTISTAAISGGGGLIKDGAGTTTLSGGATANTYSGTTTVNGGVLALNKTAGTNAIAGNITLGDGATTAGNDILRLNASNQIVDTAVITFNAATGSNAGIFRLNNQSETVAGIASTGGGGIIENESGSAATSTLTVNNSATQSFSGIIRNGDGSGIDGTLALSKTGAGTLTLTNANTFSGGTTVGAGTLTVGHVNALGTAGVSVTGGTLNLANFAVANTITASGGAIIGANSSTTVNFSDAAAINGNFGTIDTGADPSRAINTTSGLTVNTLSGQGTFSGGLVTVTQAHNPGNSPGSQTFNDGLAYGNNTTATFEIAANGLAFDSITVNNGLTIGSSVTLALSLFGMADYGSVFWDSAQTFQLITANSTTGSFNSITYTGLGDFAAEGTWNYNQASGALAWTVIPEPSTAILGGLGLLALLRRRR